MLGLAAFGIGILLPSSPTPPTPRRTGTTSGPITPEKETGERRSDYSPSFYLDNIGAEADRYNMASASTAR
jgi:hypothetical protein